MQSRLGRLESPLASASTDRASVFIKAQPVCMTATETLVSSRLMKTDDTPPPSKKKAVKGNKKQEDEQTEKYQKKKNSKKLPKNKNTS